MASLAEAFEIARQHHQQGNLQQAEQIYRQILAVDAGYHPALHLLGYLAMQVGQSQPALELISKAVSLAPHEAEYHNSLGLVYANATQYAQSVPHFKRAIEVDPRFLNGLSNLASALADAGQANESLQYFDRALALNPNSATVLSNYGNSLAKLGELDRAIDALTRATKLQPGLTNALNNLGMALHRRGRLIESYDMLQRAVANEPNHADATFNTAIGHLLHGDFDRGWAEYEWRFRLNSFVPHALPLDRPRWDGGHLEGKTIFVQGEQGLGDIIQFARYLPLITHRGGRVVFQCHAALVRLMRSMKPVDQILSFTDALPQADVQVPMLSLPHIFGTQVDSIPAEVPYLFADPQDIQTWRQRLSDVPAGLRVGLAWSGSSTHGGDMFRSIKASQLAPLAQAKGVQFFSLQLNRRDDPPAELAVHDFTSHIQDFADTAGLVHHLDLVISVDTSVVHLVGAMNKPIWMLTPIGPDFRWLLGRDDSPWYPSMRLYRQQHFGDWGHVMNRIADDLKSLARR